MLKGGVMGIPVEGDLGMNRWQIEDKTLKEKVARIIASTHSMFNERYAPATSEEFYLEAVQIHNLYKDWLKDRVGKLEVPVKEYTVTAKDGKKYKNIGAYIDEET